MSSAELKFAREFLRHRINGHRKDVQICLTGSHSRHTNRHTHAYFPALMITIGFAELLAGLHDGSMSSRGAREKIKSYFRMFVAAPVDFDERLDVLYEGFRHKIAHLGHPYAVFDTGTRRSVFEENRRYAWTVYARGMKPAVRLTKFDVPRTLRTGALPPWPVDYDARIYVSVSSLSASLTNSVFRRGGYFSSLAADKRALLKFISCMREFYPQSALTSDSRES